MDGKVDLEISKKKKKAVLIGLKHPNPEMNNAIDIKGQILRMKKHLMEFRGFSEDNITLMIDHDDNDDDEEPINKYNITPTDFNLRRTLYPLIGFAERGDILFIHLIAYGCTDGRIIAADKEHLYDCFFRGLIRVAVENGCNLTFVSDCLIELARRCPCPVKQLENPINCKELNKTTLEATFGYSPILVKCLNFSHKPTHLSYVDILNSPNEEEIKKATQDRDHGDDDDSSRVVLLMPFGRDPNVPFTGCPYNVSEVFIAPLLKGTSSSSTITPPPPPNQHILYGGFTNAILDVMETRDGKITNLELAQKAMEKLGGEIPSLRCSQHHHAYASFVC